jgi:hypothetical protein
LHKLLIGAFALSLLGATSALAQPPMQDQGHHDMGGDHRDDRGGPDMRGDHRDGWDHHGWGHHHHRMVCSWRHHHRVCWRERGW